MIDLDDAGHSPSLRDIQRRNAPVGNSAADGHRIGHALLRVVGRIRCSSAHLKRPVDAGERLTDDSRSHRLRYRRGHAQSVDEAALRELDFEAVLRLRLRVAQKNPRCIGKALSRDRLPF